MNYYEHWLGDYRKKTARLRFGDHAAYRLLLDEYYAMEQPLPAAYADLYEICGAVAKADQASVRKVADLYFPVDSADGLRHNARADEEIDKARPRIEASRKNGKHGGRKKTHDEPDGNPTGTRQAPRREPDSNPAHTPPATRPGEALPHAPHAIPQSTTEPAGVSQPSADANPWPIGLRPETWREWRSHLGNRGKSMTPQQERLQLVRLMEHPDAEQTVLDTIAKGNVSLPPVGGWPSDQRRAPGALSALTAAGRKTAENLANWQPPAPKENVA